MEGEVGSGEAMARFGGIAVNRCGEEGPCPPAQVTWLPEAREALRAASAHGRSRGRWQDVVGSHLVQRAPVCSGHVLTGARGAEGDLVPPELCHLSRPAP